jgi:FkbM family methyltransferase
MEYCYTLDEVVEKDCYSIDGFLHTWRSKPNYPLHVVDIGANFGVFTQKIIAECEGRWLVFDCYEPIRQTYTALLDIFASINPEASIACVPIGLGTGQPLYLAPNPSESPMRQKLSEEAIVPGPSPCYGEWLVKLLPSLDEVEKETLVIKIDCEGGEYAMLKEHPVLPMAAQTEILRASHFFCMEIHPSGEYNQLMDYLMDTFTEKHCPRVFHLDTQNNNPNKPHIFTAYRAG